MQQIKGVIFDKDGTLFDFHASWAAWSAGLLQELAGEDAERCRALGRAIGFDPDTLRFAPDSVVIAGTPEEIAERMLPHLPGTNLSGLIARMNLLSAQAPLVPAVALRPLLAELKGRGLRIGLATNDAERPARAHLAHAGIDDLFDFIAGFDSGYGAKPDCGQLDAFADAFGLDASEVVMVGDSRHDLSAGQRAGMATVAVLTGLAPEGDLAPLADAVLPDIGHLPDWLNRRSIRAA